MRQLANDWPVKAPYRRLPPTEIPAGYSEFYDDPGHAPRPSF